MKNIIAYYRVSTKRQGKSGLGLEAQQEALRVYQQSHNVKLLASYQEVESGKRADRPELARALAHAKRSGAVLVVAKLDRLARNVAFLSAIMESGVDFVCCDMEYANRLTIHIMAAMAEHEAKMISERTKAALAAYKRRGGLLGGSRPECRNLTDTARARGIKHSNETNHAKAIDSYSDLLPTMIEWREEGVTLQQIADNLNDKGHTTRRGKPWNHVQVMRVLSLAD